MATSVGRRILASAIESGAIRYEISETSRKALLSLPKIVDDLSESAILEYDKLVTAWIKRYNRLLPGAIRGAMHNRRDKGSISEGVSLVLHTRNIVPEKSGIWHMRITSADSKLLEAAKAQEEGRKKGGGIQGKYYMVPLNSWMETKTRKFTTADIIEKDLSDEKPWFRIKINTKTGPAEMFLRYKDRAKKKSKARVTARSLTRGRGPARKGNLKKVADAMYLGYKFTTGIYGDHTEDKLRKKQRALKQPLAAIFGVNLTDSAPRWFSRANARFMGALVKSVTLKENIKVDITSRGRRLGGPGGEDISVLEAFVDFSAARIDMEYLMDED